MKTLDRVILAVIALALTVIALNPWVAPGYVSAQRGIVEVDIWGIGGRSILQNHQKVTGLPVEIKGPVNVLR